MGKGPGYLAKLAKQFRKPVIAYAGILGKDVAVCKEHGIDAYFPTLPPFMSVEEAMEPKTAYRNLRETVYNTFREMKNGSTLP
jgi:glycerate kinase